MRKMMMLETNGNNLSLEFPPELYLRFLPLLIKLQQEGHHLNSNYHAQQLIKNVCEQVMK